MDIKPNPGWRGDPTFLTPVLRAFGLRVNELPGAYNRGHGDFGTIQGLVPHHIGSKGRYGPEKIAHHPTLGLCSQLHLDRDGTVTLCGVGIAYHAGKGSHPGWPTNDANRVSIGIEAESDGLSPWPKEQMDAYYKTCAAILWFLGKRATPQTLLAHWEYSQKAQGKWDPGAGNGRIVGMNMDDFRSKVNRLIDNPPFVVEQPKKEDDLTAFDFIARKFRSRVPGSDVQLRPIDALLNADAHSFISRANTEKILARLDGIEEKLNGN